MAEQKTYINGATAKQVTFQNGNTILKLNLHVDKLIEQLTKYRNERGYVNLGISARREVGRYGETHSVWLDTWQPAKKDGQPAGQPHVEPAPWEKAGPVNEQDALPF